MTEVIAVIGPGSIGQAIAMRVSAGKHAVLICVKRMPTPPPGPSAMPDSK